VNVVVSDCKHLNSSEMNFCIPGQ